MMYERLPPEERVTRTFPEEVRRRGARRLTELMKSMRPFSFIRMGDRELALLIAQQHGKTIDWVAAPSIESSCGYAGGPGLDMEQVSRLRRAYSRATYVDFGQRIWMHRALVPMLEVDREPCALQNLGEEDSHIFMDWFRYEFRGYACDRRKIMFAGGEGALLRELLKSEAFRTAAHAYWSEDSSCFCLEATSAQGSRLESTKKVIADSIRENGIDTVFI